MADRIEGLRNTHKSERLVWNSTTTAHLCPIWPTTVLIGSFQSTAWNSVVMLSRVPSLTAPRTVPRCLNPTELRESRRTGTWFHSCLFMCTRLELFISPRIWAPSQGPCEHQKTVMESVCPSYTDQVWFYNLTFACFVAISMLWLL